MEDDDQDELEDTELLTGSELWYCGYGSGCAGESLPKLLASLGRSCGVLSEEDYGSLLEGWESGKADRLLYLIEQAERAEEGPVKEVDSDTIPF